MTGRMLHFGAFLYTPGCHPTGWRHPDAVCETDLSFAGLVDIARTAERGCLDALFFQDSVAVSGAGGLDGRPPFNPRTGRQAYLEPLSAIAGLAAVTERLGLISTATTSYNQPFDIARRFLTIDHISGGRVGWNLVTSQLEDEALNFGRDAHFEHGFRYERAAEFHDVVVGLWDSGQGGFAHLGTHFTQQGGLGVARSPQGRPVVAQAGSSNVGMELAARTADMVFTAQTTIPEGQAFCADMHARMARYGRRPREMVILPGLMPVIGRTMAEAEDKFAALRDLVDDEVGLRAVNRLAGGLNIYDFDPDGPLPDLPPSNAARARQDMIIAMGQRGMSIRAIGRVMGMSMGHRVLHGTPASLADEMQAWLEAGAADGFNLLFPHYPRPLYDFVDLVVPELQRRGIFRRAYEGATLRENLGVREAVHG
jgi:alkanesulfonate monooxygenase SsuD/methylene tetrahydromethanopterin reductase-like flavin-dependent oxidoreductase (luciferase family)